MKRLASYFLNGLLLVAPIFITLYVLYSIFKTVDGFLEAYIESWLGFFQPGIGVLIILVLLTILGFIAETTVIRPLKNIFSRLVRRIPVINFIFASLNDLFTAFAGKEKKFNVPVAVLVNKENDLWKLGFLTKESLEELNIEEKVAVYFPHSYNFSGELFLVSPGQIKKIEMSPAEVMKFIVSGGVTRFNNE
ncbi:MAG TPA: DUF502 domain-containing protein [Prolixibacteraceae bacterium]|mgnify:CR=1 FL=1|nr:DUF502 domain-containing protein [Prolixibacteraceae bacterium]